MTAIWQRDDTQWQPVSPRGFPDEATLHTLVEEAPHMLPLSGSASLIVLGREVQLGNGRADLIAVENSGRLCVIEIKLAYNNEARHAVVTQVLAYAAYLRGMTVETLEQYILRAHLHAHEYTTIDEAVAASDQAGAFDRDSFRDELANSLRTGRFRLLIVLDKVPDELVRLVGYLESVTDGLLIDLVTVSAYDISGVQILVPQRIDPEHERARRLARNQGRPALPTGQQTEGSDEFRAGIDEAPEEDREALRRLTKWAEELEQEGLVRLSTYHRMSDRWTLLPWLQSEDAGLVTIWNNNGATYLTVWRSVFEHCAPESLTTVEQLLAPAKLGQGNAIYNIEDTLLDALTDAYREAAGVTRERPK